MTPDAPVRLAVVDDDPSVRRAVRRLLSALGLEVVTHDSGVEFLASRELHEVDALLLDVHMPGLSGMSVLREVQEAATKLPVVLTTGRYDPDFAERALDAGASGVLRKPFTESQLVEAIARAIGAEPVSGYPDP